MFDETADDRTEQPTPTRRDEARRSGQVPRSRDLTVALSVFGGFAAACALGPWFACELGELVRTLLQGVTLPVDGFTPEVVQTLASGVGLAILRLALPLAGVVCAVAAATAVLQAGWRVRFEAVLPDVTRLSPLAGLGRLFGVRGLGRGVFAAAKITVVGWLLFTALESLLTDSVSPGEVASGTTLQAGVAASWGHVSGFGLRLGFALLLLAVFDYGLQFWLNERTLRMTPAEIREENQRMEGDPAVKDRRRRFWSQVRSQQSQDEAAFVSGSGNTSSLPGAGDVR